MTLAGLEALRERDADAEQDHRQHERRDGGPVGGHVGDRAREGRVDGRVSARSADSEEGENAEDTSFHVVCFWAVGGCFRSDEVPGCRCQSHQNQSKNNSMPTNANTGFMPCGLITGDAGTCVPTEPVISRSSRDPGNKIVTDTAGEGRALTASPTCQPCAMVTMFKVSSISGPKSNTIFAVFSTAPTPFLQSKCAVLHTTHLTTPSRYVPATH